MALIFTTGFLAVFRLSGLALPNRKKTGRFRCGADLGTIGSFRPLADIMQPTPLPLRAESHGTLLVRGSGTSYRLGAYG